MNKTGYVNGSDLLLFINGKAVGHATSHTTTFNSETKDRAVKPIASASMTAGKWKEKGVTGMSVSISAEGLRNFDESEHGMRTLLAAWAAGESVEVKAIERGNDAKPYLSGRFIIASLEEIAPAEDDATYNISLENDGEITLNPESITENPAAE